VPKEAYQVPMVAFSTAFGLNFLTLMFERESVKFQVRLQCPSTSAHVCEE